MVESLNQINKPKINIAIVGCLHGHLKDIYEEIQTNELITNKKIDLVLICGDFQVH